MAPGRRSVHDSVTVQPPAAGARSYAQSEIGTPTHVTVNANRRPGSAAVTLHVVVHCSGPRRLLPRNRAPTSAHRAPSTQRQDAVSGLHSPVRVTSLTSA